MGGRTWKNVNTSTANKIKKYLLRFGGEEQEVRSLYEDWRVRFSDSTFTYYKSGTLFSTTSNSKDPEVFKAWQKIDSIVGSAYALPSKDFLIGLDETGKGEAIGHTVLTGVVFPKEIFKEIDLLIGPADTKKRHEFEYWDDIFMKLDKLRVKDLVFIYEKIPPWHVDKYNLNKIMDVSYQRIISIFLRKVDISRCRIVLDDYGIGDTLKRFLNFLEQKGAEVIVTQNSEDKYLESKTASLISKRQREAIVKAINENPEFQIGGLSVGSGNAGDPKTNAWLKAWWNRHQSWPWFVKRSFKNVRRIEGKSEVIKKILPPINERLLSDEFLENFNKGKFSIKSLSLVCPHCGMILKSAEFVIFKKNGRNISGIKCVNKDCGKIIDNAGITLRYYCGYVLPDSNAIIRNVISQDLKSSRFFENFTIILSPVVRKECDGTSKGKKEFEELAKFNSMGRIKLESVGKLEEIPDKLNNKEKDERIIEECIKYNAILLTGDKSMYAFAGGRNVFTIYL
jgi:ribonuclease HII